MNTTKGQEKPPSCVPDQELKPYLVRGMQINISIGKGCYYLAYPVSWRDKITIAGAIAKDKAALLAKLEKIL